jgi:large subunit ribosomal protein L13
MQKTHVTKCTDIDRKWYLIDADGANLGRLAVIVADLLRGKNKPSFSPSVDCGDYVVVVNTDKLAVTGNKMLDKKYYNYSGFPGGMRELRLEELMAKDSTAVLKLAVKGMLPKNRLAADIIAKLRAFPSAEHDHTAQKPEIIKVKG